MRAKFINEKFSDESDPIRDMNIGLKFTLFKYELNNMMNILRISDNDLRKIHAFLGDTPSDIYWLGDTSINAEKELYFKHIHNIIETQNLDKKSKYNIAYANWIVKKALKFGQTVCTTYKTSKGKILEMKYFDSGRIETMYFGDIDMAFNVQVVQNKIYEDL